MSEGMNNKLSNVMGVPLPPDLRKQFQIRSAYNSSVVSDSLPNTADFSRTDDNIKYLANKSAWIRLVSSVNVVDDDLQYYQKKVPSGISLADPSDLAKYFILSAGTSIYRKDGDSFKYDFRAGLETNGLGSYGNFGSKTEIQNYGYRPMPGIMDAKIKTTGRLGSVREATVSFKVWTKDQLDIIDALYFKMGYLMFLEWGHTYYYDNDGKLQQMGVTIDPFADNLDKETLNHQISELVEKTYGNYDAMLGMCTSFNFSFNQEGGYDCEVKMIGLGALADATKINQGSTLPDINDAELKSYITAYINKKVAEELAAKVAEIDAKAEANIPKFDAAGSINEYILKNDKAITETNINDYSVPSFIDTVADLSTKGSLIVPESHTNVIPGVYYRTLGINIPTSGNFSDSYETITFSDQWKNYLLSWFKSSANTFTGADNFKSLTIIQNEADIKKITSSGREGSEVSRLTHYAKAKIGTNDANLEISLNLDGSITMTGVSYLTSPTNGGKYAVQVSVTIKDSDFKNHAKWEQNYTSPNTLDLPQIVDLYDGKHASDQFYDAHTYYEFPQWKEHKKFSDKQLAWFLILFKNIIVRSALTPSISNSNPISVINVGGVGPGNPSSTLLTSKKNNSFYIRTYLTGTYYFWMTVTDPKAVGDKTSTATLPAESTITAEVNIYNDPSIYSKITPKSGVDPKLYFNEFKEAELNAERAKVNAEAATAKEAAKEQIETTIKEAVSEEAVKYNSGLEIMFRAIQLHALNTIIGNSTDITAVKPIPLETSFIKELFSKGIFADSIDKFLTPDGLEKLKEGLKTNASKRERMLAYASYGYNHNLLGAPTNKIEEIAEKLEQCEFSEMFKAYVLPWDINQSIAQNVEINHPVFVRLDLLIFAINHMCMIYDTKEGTVIAAEDQKPVIYFDFNTMSNTCLSSPLQMSVDIQKFLIQFRATDSEYLRLFEDKYIKDFEAYDKLLKDGITLEAAQNKYDSQTEKNKILILDKINSDTRTQFFKPQTEDMISFHLPEFKVAKEGDSDSWRGHIMRVLINVDYLLNLCQSFATKDDSHGVYLKPFFTQLVTDLNKSLGDMNVFRVAYSDKGNCLYITDDQTSPTYKEEDYVKKLLTADKRDDLDKQLGVNLNSIQLPLYGRKSIAKSLNIKTEVSTKLSNMLAISANSDKKASSGQDSTPFGVYNKNFTNRYMKQVSSVDAGQIDTADYKAASQFNTFVNSIFRTDKPQMDSISQAINYYVERMNGKKSEAMATRASAMIPVSIDFTTNGISGFTMGQAFTVPPILLPNTYAKLERPVGWVVIGADHSITNNTWDTSIRANMMYLKDNKDFLDIPDSFNIKTLAQGNITGDAAISSNSGGTNNPTPTSYKKASSIAAAIAALPDAATFKSAVEQMASEFSSKAEYFYAIMYAESGIRPDIVNSIGATGLIQFLKSTAVGLGTTTDQLSKMSATSQVEYVKKYFKNGGLRKGATLVDLYAIVFFPLIAKHINDDSWIIQSGKQTAELISQQNPAIARAAGKTRGTPLNVGDFKKYVNSIA